jgi:hypothetical protein
MNITTTKLHSRPQLKASPAPQEKLQEQAPADTVTFGMYRSTKRKLITAGSVVVGAGVGSVALANLTGEWTGTAAKIAGGVGGGVVGGLALGIAGVAVAARFSDTEGFGGLAEAAVGMAVGGAIGGVAGAYFGSGLGTGAGNVLGYAVGALAGGAVGGLAAKGFLN